jgi:hypothetical protein
MSRMLYHLSYAAMTAKTNGTIAAAFFTVNRNRPRPCGILSFEATLLSP